MEILFEDSDLMVVNKPAGVLSESNGGDEDSMLDQVSRHIGRRAIGYHRIDRATSGCLLFGKTSKFNKQIGKLFQDKKVRKEYWALVDGSWPGGLSKVETEIGPVGGGVFANLTDGSGKQSITTFQILGRFEGYTWLKCLPKTGRTHQIRLHCLSGGCAIVGDSLYGKSAESGLALHARSIQFPHPGRGPMVKVIAEPSNIWAKWTESATE